jgi:hypothetical protein
MTSMQTVDQLESEGILFVLLRKHDYPITSMAKSFDGQEKMQKNGVLNLNRAERT